MCVRWSVNKKIQFWSSISFLNTDIFRQLKLEIALAIPALNEGKIETNNSAASGLSNHRTILMSLINLAGVSVPSSQIVTKIQVTT